MGTLNKPVAALELQCCCGNRSGIGQYTLELARRLKADDELEFRGNLFNFAGRNDNSGVESSVPFPVESNRLMPYGIYRRLWNSLPLPYGKMFSPADVNIFFNYIIPPGVQGKSIAVIYDMTYLRFPETMDGRNLARLETGMADSLRRCDHIITILEFSKREISGLLQIPPEKISVVYAAASLSAEIGSFKVLQKKYNLFEPYILFVGSIEPRKNLLRLIKAFELFKERSGLSHKLVLAGGSGWRNGEIFAAAETSPYASDIIFTGYVTDSDKKALYKNAQMLAFPSLYEGFGMPVAEAMALGCPIMCSCEASLPEIAGDAAVYADAYDIESIERGMETIAKSGELRRSCAVKGLLRSEHFSWERSALQLREICKKVLNGS